MQTVALSGLVAALGLARYMYHSAPAELHRTLMDHIYRTHDNIIRDVATAMLAGQDGLARSRIVAVSVPLGRVPKA